MIRNSLWTVCEADGSEADLSSASERESLALSDLGLCSVSGARSGPEQRPKTGRQRSKNPECHETQTEFQHNTTLLLLELTRTYQHLYNRNKISFYKKLEEAFNAKGYSCTNDKIRRKLGNMLTTYKRAKDRSRTTGEGKITWEYYMQMDEIFSGSGVGSAPPGTITSTPLFPSHTSSELSRSTLERDTDDQQPGPSTATQTTHPSAKKRVKTKTSFQDTCYESHAERRTAALESLLPPNICVSKCSRIMPTPGVTYIDMAKTPLTITEAERSQCDHKVLVNREEKIIQITCNYRS
ncbi:hypothetical protein ABVT39_001678 [Epinephelus coioides]